MPTSLQNLNPRYYLVGSIALAVVALLLFIGAVWYVERQNASEEAGFREGVIFDNYEGAQEEFSLDKNSLASGAEGNPRAEELLEQIDEYDKQLQDDDLHNDIDAYMGMAFNARVLGDNETAVAGYRAVLNINPRHPLALNNLTTSYKELKEYEKAEAVYLQLIGHHPDEVRTYRSLADIYRYSLTHKEQFIPAVMEEGLAANAGNPDLLSYLAVYYEEKGDFAQAVLYYERTVAANPDNQAAQQKLTELRARGF